MGFIRFLLFLALIYLVYRLVRNLFPALPKQPPRVKGDAPEKVPPPYDPGQVEDIDYKEVRPKDRNNA
ncbi:MAG: hypothetical protein HUU32_03765 [Calditrichaceae bacterium]|nr:hypothetical protein [Calditrichia bacterium]NUQ40493.1 hypothetical protein [Calditrichaceae bacterium]